MDRLSLIILVLMAATVALGAIAWMSGSGQRRLARRARRMALPGGGRRKAGGPQLRRERDRAGDAFLSRILPNPEKFMHRLSSTGMDLSVANYLTFCGVAAGLCTLTAVLLGLPLGPALLIGIAGGLLLPHFFVGQMIARRRKAFSKSFPDAIGLMVRGLKAGLPASESVGIVGREMKGPVAEEFQRAGDGVRLGQTLEDALWIVARRIDLQEVNFLVTTLGIQKETGGNLAETLENLDEMLRKRAQMKLKVKAMSSEAMATAMIIGSLPFVMTGLMFVVANKYIMTLFVTDMGHVLIGGGAVWLAIGAFVMSQMVKFEI